MADMHANTNKAQANFSSYLTSHKTTGQDWDSPVETCFSDNSCDYVGDLPPPPLACGSDRVIEPKSIPCGPAKPWNLDVSDEEMSDEGKENMRIKDEEGSDSDSEGHDSHSECTTEIYVPKSDMETKASVSHRRCMVSSKPQKCSIVMRRRPETGCDVIPSVSNDNLWLTSPNKSHREMLTEEIATNIDSGISNETSHAHSHDGAAVQHRTQSISSSSHYSSSYSCGSRGNIPSPKIGQQTRKDNIAIYMREAKVSRVVDMLSATYALSLVILHSVFYTLELDNSMAFQGYFIYSYGLGIVFLAYVYTTIIRASRRPPSPHIVHRMSSEMAHHCSLYKDNIGPAVGNLFLRVSTVLLCVGSVANITLTFGVSISLRCDDDPYSTAQTLLQVIFLLLQIYFVFNNASMRLRRYPITAKFGIMHLLATNVSACMSTVISELGVSSINPPPALDVNETLMYNSVHVTAVSKGTETSDAASNCTNNKWLISMADNSKPYVYPCTIQFCILACGILFVVWRKIDRSCDTQCSECRESWKRSNESGMRTVDCANTSGGLFLGILGLVTALASLLAFFMLTTNDYYDIRATLVMQIFHIAVYLIMTVVAVVALLRLRTLDYNACRSTLLEDMLVILSIIALSIYNLLSILSAVLSLHTMKGLLVLASSCAELIQSVVQMAVITLGLKLCSPNVIVSTSSKPGRECVTLLAVINIALWLLSIFHNVLAQNYEVQHMVLGQMWSYVAYIVEPIVMLYHLFSASCFIDIWYNAYRLPGPSAVHV